MIPKFRAWHKEKKQMYMVCDLEWFAGNTRVILRRFLGDQPIRCSINDVHLMQWTGFTTFDGVELFDGDIIHMHDHYFVARYNQGRGQFEVVYAENKEFAWYCSLCKVYPVKIVGNVFENAELILEFTID